MSEHETYDDLNDKASVTKPQSDDSAFILNIHSASSHKEHDIGHPVPEHTTYNQETRTALPERDVSPVHKNCVHYAGQYAHRAVKFYLDNYVLLILTAALGVALNVTCIKILSARVSVFQITAIRSCFCSIVLLGTCWWKGISLIEPRHLVPLFLLRGIFGAIAFFGLAMSTYALPLSISSFIANSYPVTTSLLSWAFGMERLGFLSWFGVGGCVIGNALVAQPPFLFGDDSEWDTTRILGVGAGIVTNIFMACTFILIRYIGKSVPTIVFTTYMHLFCFFLSIPFLVTRFPMPISLTHSRLDLLCYGATCLLGIGLQLASTRALQIGPPTKVTSLYMTNMLLSGIVGMVFLSESVSPISSVGAGIIVISVIVVTAQTPKKEEPPHSASTEKNLKEFELANQSDSQA